MASTLLLATAVWLVCIEGFRQQIATRTSGAGARKARLVGALRILESGIHKHLFYQQQNGPEPNLTKAIKASVAESGIASLLKSDALTIWPAANANLEKWTNREAASEIAVFLEERELGVFAIDFSGNAIITNQRPQMPAISIQSLWQEEPIPAR